MRRQKNRANLGVRLALARMSKKQSIAVFGAFRCAGDVLAAPVLGHKAVGFIHVVVVIFQISSLSGLLCSICKADAHAASSFTARSTTTREIKHLTVKSFFQHLFIRWVAHSQGSDTLYVPL
jgi:hypothetical protein